MIRVAIIGAGFSGLCLAIHLKKIGVSFTIFEKGDRVGGTWRDNTYPGAACDAASALYCYSFEQKTDWSRKWAGQDEILAYIEHCVRKYALADHIRLAVEVVSARFDADRGTWRIRTSDGTEQEAEILVSAVGQLHRPYVPDLTGLGDFLGDCFHSAEWRHGVDLEGRTAAVVGTAASAIQLIPEIAPRLEMLFVYQRSPNWVLPKFDRVYSESTKRRLGRHPWLARLTRWAIWLQLELFHPVFRRNRLLAKPLEVVAKGYLRSIVEDPALRRALVPDYPIGGKRILISDDYYRTLTRNNVELITSQIDRISEDSVITRDGRENPVDVLILATGFRTTEFLEPIVVEGLRGRVLGDVWKNGAEAYLGMTVPGFPNFFMMYGPNTNLGHNSILFMIECQTRYIIECVRAISDPGTKYLDLHPDVARAFNRELHRHLQGSAWAQTARTWYKNREGKIVNNWGRTTTRYWWRTRRVDFTDFHREPR